MTLTKYTFSSFYNTLPIELRHIILSFLTREEKYPFTIGCGQPFNKIPRTFMTEWKHTLSVIIDPEHDTEFIHSISHDNSLNSIYDLLNNFISTTINTYVKPSETNDSVFFEPFINILHRHCKGKLRNKKKHVSHVSGFVLHPFISQILQTFDNFNREQPFSNTGSLKLNVASIFDIIKYTSARNTSFSFIGFVSTEMHMDPKKLNNVKKTSLNPLINTLFNDSDTPRNFIIDNTLAETLTKIDVMMQRLSEIRFEFPNNADQRHFNDYMDKHQYRLSSLYSTLKIKIYRIHSKLKEQAKVQANAQKEQAKAQKEQAKAQSKAQKEQAKAQAKAQKEQVKAEAKAQKEQAKAQAKTQKEEAKAQAKA